MKGPPSDYITHNGHDNALDRRGFLKCMAWAGTGVIWSIIGGLLTFTVLGQAATNAGAVASAELNFVQISDSHIGLVNVANVQEGGLGTLGQAQLEWLEKDLKGLSASTPLVLFAHIPLWAVYPRWGWGTEDPERALALVRRFGSVTVLNGHIHQVMQKVEGNITFHTARGTAFPLPTPGSVPKPVPVVVEATHLKQMLGLTRVRYTETDHSLAVVDATLA